MLRAVAAVSCPPHLSMFLFYFAVLGGCLPGGVCVCEGSRAKSPSYSTRQCPPALVSARAHHVDAGLCVSPSGLSACRPVGHRHEAGHGCVDPGKRRRWLTEARSHGSAHAAINIACVYVFAARRHAAFSSERSCLVQHALEQFEYARGQGWHPDPASRVGASLADATALKIELAVAE